MKERLNADNQLLRHPPARQASQSSRKLLQKLTPALRSWGDDTEKQMSITELEAAVCDLHVGRFMFVKGNINITFVVLADNINRRVEMTSGSCYQW